MLHYTLFTEGVDKIAQNYLRQQGDVPDARERWQGELDTLRKFYAGHLVDWASRPVPAHYHDEQYPNLFDEVRLAADDLTLGEFARICEAREGCAGLYPLMQKAATTKGRKWLDVFKAVCRTVEQRQTAFDSFADLAQDVLDADPATLPQRDVGLASRGWLDSQPLVLPFSTKWENTRQEAAEVMRYTDRVQL